MKFGKKVILYDFNGINCYEKGGEPDKRWTGKTKNL